MYLTVTVFAQLLAVHGIFAVPMNVDRFDNDYPDNRIPATGNHVTWKGSDAALIKRKYESLLEHNEVDPDNKVNQMTTTLATTNTPETTATPDEKQVLTNWLSSIPNNIFNLRNRIRLASLFLVSQTKDDVIKKLGRATGSSKHRHGRRRSARRRRIRKQWPVPYHPNVRFMSVNKYRRPHHG